MWRRRYGRQQVGRTVTSGTRAPLIVDSHFVEHHGIACATNCQLFTGEVDFVSSGFCSIFMMTRKRTATTAACCRSRSRMLTAVVCSGRTCSHCSKGQWEAIGAAGAPLPRQASQSDLCDVVVKVVRLGQLPCRRCEGGQRRCDEQRAHIRMQTHLSHPLDEGHRQQRMPAELEEVISPADPLHPRAARRSPSVAVNYSGLQGTGVLCCGHRRYIRESP